jgi:opacity protein-like surface antigen
MSLLPAGRFNALAFSSYSGDMAAAWAVAVSFDYEVTRWLSLGLGPQFTPHFRGSSERGAEAIGNLLDLNARLRFGYPVHERLYPYLLVEPGLAVRFYEAFDRWNTQTAVGLGASAGLAIRVAGGLSVNVETGYRLFREALLDAHVLTTSVGVRYAF